MKLKNLLLTLLVTMAALPISAQLESGKIYRFVNKADASIAMGAVSTTSVYGVSVADNNYGQLWLAEKHPNNSNAWSLRSLGNGLYLKPMGTSTKWTFNSKPSSSTVLYCINTGGSYYTMNNTTSAGGQCMHYATSQGGAIVGWNTTADATHWSIEEVSVDPEDLQANWEELDAFNSLLTDEFKAECETALANLFSDKACTELKKSYASVAELEADADYQALPATLQNMAMKVYTGEWSEGNFDSSKPGWDSEHSKRFRVQSIEPYSVAGEITAWLGINAHANMDNPTGIIGNSRQHVFIFVEGEIKSGAELSVGSLVGHGMLDAYENGTPLKEGMNIIAFHGDKNSLFINYVVHTYQNGTFPNKLSEFPSIKVHIEGGNITGYYNGVGDHLWGEPDDDEDWQYYEDRSVVESATLLGKRQVLHFCMHDTKYVVDEETGSTAWEVGMSYYLPNRVSVPTGTPANQKVNAMLEVWDRIHLSEFATMGLLSKEEMDSMNNLFPRYDQNWQKVGNIYDYSEKMYQLQDNRDYSEYINHHGVALGNFSGYMSGGWRNCNYHHNTMNSIIGEIVTNAGSTWGPGHEIGHQHQSVITVNGLTEVTNNLHANVAVWYMGMATSRVNGSEGCLENVNTMYQEGTHFLFHHQIGSANQNLWTQTQMYFKLWLYFHRIGVNTDFYPRLHELCRQYRLSSNALGSYEGISHTSGTASTLRFYEHACEAAQMDLTEFFRAYGFFFPLDHELRGDYSNSYYTQTQQEIDASIARVKAKGYPETLTPLFINDCVATPSYGHDGKTKRSYWDPDQTSSGQNATIGMYTTCMDQSVQAEGYLYNISNGKVTISHDSKSKGAIGFIAYKDGKLVAFSNHYTFTLPAGVTSADIYAVQANGEKAKVLSAAEAGTEDQQYQALGKALSSASTLLKNTNLSYVGNFHTSAIAYLQSLYDAAKAEYDNKTQNTNSYGRWAIILTDEINRLVTDTKAMISIKATNVYTLVSNANKSYGIASYNNALKAVNTATIGSASDYRKWEVVASDEKDVFYLKNVATGCYIGGVESNEIANVTALTTNVATRFVATYNGDGTVSLSKQDDYNASLNRNSGDNTIRGYNISDAGSKWLIKIIEDNAHALELAQINELITDANRIMDEVGSAESINEFIVPLVETLPQLVSDLETAKENAEAGIDDIELSGYIEELSAAIEAIDGTYIVMPVSSHEGTTTWYYIKSIDKGTYCTSNATGTGNYADAMTHAALDREDRSFWWAFVATGNENEFEIYNAATETYIYTTTNSAAALKIDGAADAGRYVVSAVADKLGVTIMNGSKYMNASHKTNTRVTATRGYWKLERICTESGSLTGIEEVLDDNEETKTIYDLTGRRIEKITLPGIYIVNGKKVLVK